MKKFIGLALIALVTLSALAGCAHDVSIIEPIVGTWQNDGIGVTALVFNNDDTVVETY